MNGYIAFYNGRTFEVYSNTYDEARKAAMEHFKPPKSKKHMVTVMLAEKDGKAYVHSTSSI